jgi:hypothetical protein
MTPPNRPEWIELADADTVPQVKKLTRALPAFVLAAVFSIVGVGALVAQSDAETPATASEQVVAVLATPSASEPSTTSSMPSAVSPGKSISVSNPSTITNPTAPKQPGIASMPTGGGDDEDDENDENDDEEGDDD